MEVCLAKSILVLTCVILMLSLICCSFYVHCHFDKSKELFFFNHLHFHLIPSSGTPWETERKSSANPQTDCRRRQPKRVWCLCVLFEKENI